MSTYVINNRIPRFPIQEGYPDKAALRKVLEDVFQVWLKERFISNLGRRKACSQFYDFSVWLESRKEVVETSREEDFPAWCAARGLAPLGDWGDFLRYARLRVKSLAWKDQARMGKDPGVSGLTPRRTARPGIQGRI